VTSLCETPRFTLLTELASVPASFLVKKRTEEKRREEKIERKRIGTADRCADVQQVPVRMCNRYLCGVQQVYSDVQHVLRNREPAMGH